MKKYIAPIAKFIDLQSEGSLMNTSDITDGEGNDLDLSNRRHASESLWGYEE